MLTKIEVVNAASQTLVLDMFDSSNGYNLERVEGLEPVKASFASSTLAKFDGELFQSSRTDKRNIVITLGLEADYESGTSVRDRRRALYRFFIPRAEVLLRFFMGGSSPFAEIEAHVESFESPFFEEYPQVTISLLCFDPYFRRPFEDVSYQNMGSSPVSVNYNGDIETGVRVTFGCPVAFSGVTFTVTNDLYGSRSLSIDFDFEIDDGVTIETTPGKKEITLHRGGLRKSLLAYLEHGSVWPLLTPGTNALSTVAGSTIPWPPYPWVEFKYITRYGGL